MLIQNQETIILNIYNDRTFHKPRRKTDLKFASYQRESVALRYIAPTQISLPCHVIPQIHDLKCS